MGYRPVYIRGGAYHRWIHPHLEKLPKSPSDPPLELYVPILNLEKAKYHWHEYIAKNCAKLFTVKTEIRGPHGVLRIIRNDLQPASAYITKEEFEKWLGPTKSQDDLDNEELDDMLGLKGGESDGTESRDS